MVCSLTAIGYFRRNIFSLASSKFLLRTGTQPSASLPYLHPSDGRGGVVGIFTAAHRAKLAAMACHFRVIFVNDVYLLDNLPRLKTCLDKYRTGSNTVTLVSGDFLAPSLLSSLDHGHGMVDCLNKVGVDYVCFGNHECDVPHTDLLRRIKESKFTWINTNMQDIDLQGLPKLPDKIVLEVKGPGCTRKVGLLGLCSADPGLYRAGSYNGATIEPVIPTFLKYQQQLEQEDNVDLIVPMTHQSIYDDRELAKTADRLPIVVGGHEHEAYDETVNHTRILKMGQDAAMIGVIDFVWEEPEDTTPVVTVEKLMARDFDADPTVQKAMEMHYQLLEELRQAAMAVIPRHGLSSKNIRLKQTSLGTLLVTAMRDAFLAEGAMFNAGGIRASKEYSPDQRFFTFADFEAEMPFDNDICVVRMPGKVIAETVKFSRRKSFLDPPVEFGGFFQLDKDMVFDDEKQELTHIGQKPLDPEREYEVVVVKLHLEGIDNVEPLVAWARENPSRIPKDGLPCKSVVVSYFSRFVWFKLGMSFCEIDTNADGKISREEFTRAAEKIFNVDLVPFVVDTVFEWVDTNGDGVISKGEMLAAVLDTAFSMFDKNSDDVLEEEEIHEFATKVLGCAIDDQALKEIMDVFDHDQDGQISRAEVRCHVLKARC